MSDPHTDDADRERNAGPVSVTMDTTSPLPHTEALGDFQGFAPSGLATFRTAARALKAAEDAVAAARQAYAEAVKALSEEAVR